MGPAKIKKVCFQVVASNQMLNALYNNEIDFVEPNAKYETVQELKIKQVAELVVNQSKLLVMVILVSMLVKYLIWQ